MEIGREGRRLYFAIYAVNIAYELGKWALIIVVLGTLCHYFLATVFIISGPSMEPDFHDRQIVLVSRIGLFTGKYRRGDAMVLKFPGDPEHKKYIKRLIGLPGETITIKNNEVYINSRKIIESYIRPVDELFLPYFYETEELAKEAESLHKRGKVMTKPDMMTKIAANSYFLMGDNRENSNDSRAWYSAKKSDLIGPVRFILWPLKDWGPVVNPYYGE